MNTIHYESNQYGFDWGALKVRRMCSHKGEVVLELSSPRGIIQVNCTKTGVLKFLTEGNVKAFKKPEQ